MTFSAEFLWAIAGLILIFLEFMMPGLVIAFFGIGALVTALFTLLGITNSLALQFVVFIVSSLLSLILLRRYFTRIFRGQLAGDNDALEFNLDVGKIVPVIEPIVPGKSGGKVKYQGSLWPASADEPIEAGEDVKIKSRDNLTIIVEKMTEKEE